MSELRFDKRYGPVTPIRCKQLDIQCTSATTCDYPDSDLLVFMYRPFTGEVFTSALDNLARFQRQTGRKVTVMLMCPLEGHLLDQHPAFRHARSYRVIDPEFNCLVYEGAADGSAVAARAVGFRTAI